ncbi:VOC family protein [Pedobacter sp. L105]|uniref:VOC family protein n=1 Tax=Pedobacter sp. L105 TaxID=1641871 RepID=UPI00131AAFB6|nr:VOC family protein [Pedobacter sp. L105]
MKTIKTLHRIYLNPDMLTSVVEFYEDLFHKDYFIRFDYTELNLTLVQLEGILLLAGTNKTWEVLPDIKKTRITMIVDDIVEVQAYLSAQKNVMILRKPKEVPTGWNMTVEHQDGTITEYVQHDEDKVNLFKKEAEKLRFINN